MAQFDKPDRKGRSRRKGREAGKKPVNPDTLFVQIWHQLLREPAWKSLSTGAQSAYLHLKRYYNGTNNGELFVSVRVLAADMGKDKNSINRWLKELQAKGFIEATQRGHLGCYGKGMASRWLLTETGAHHRFGNEGRAKLTYRMWAKRQADLSARKGQPVSTTRTDREDVLGAVPNSPTAVPSMGTAIVSKKQTPVPVPQTDVDIYQGYRETDEAEQRLLTILTSVKGCSDRLAFEAIANSTPERIHSLLEQHDAGTLTPEAIIAFVVEE